MKAVKVRTQEVKEKTKALVSFFYRALRGTPLNTCNCRRNDFLSQELCAGLKGLYRAVVIITTQMGVTFSQVMAKGNIASLNNGSAFDVAQIKGARAIPYDKAVAWASKNGRPSVIEVPVCKPDKNGKLMPTGKTERVKGRLFGSFDPMYMGFFDGKRFQTKETRALPNGRNAANLFKLIK
jgi:hypothetical protein